MPEEIPLIINPVAGQRSWLALGLEALLIQPPQSSRSFTWPEEKVERMVLRALEREGFKGRFYLTRTQGDATEIARTLVREKARRVVAVGGDGTINEVANALAGTETALGIIPLGTANTFAIELGIPLSLPKAAQLLHHGRIRTVDVGKVNDRFFVMGVGMGFEAEVIRKVSPRLKRSFGQLAYVIQGIAESQRYSFPELEVESELTVAPHTGSLVIVSNTRFYGGYFRAAPRASVEDGLLDVLVLKGKRLGNLLAYLARMRYGDVTGFPDVEYFQCHRVEVSSELPVPFHVDAEPAGTTPCEFECVPRALRVIVPGGT